FRDAPDAAAGCTSEPVLDTLAIKSGAPDLLLEALALPGSNGSHALAARRGIAPGGLARRLGALRSGCRGLLGRRKVFEILGEHLRETRHSQGGIDVGGFLRHLQRLVDVATILLERARADT